MKFFVENINFRNSTLTSNSLVCLFLATFYVISLYFWSQENRYKRNEPSVIKRRFISVIFSSLISLIVIYSISTPGYDHQSYTLFEWTGLRFDQISLLNSILVSFGLTALLFIGPITQNLFSECRNFLSDLHFENAKKYDQKTKSNQIEKSYSILILNKICLVFYKNFNVKNIVKAIFNLEFLRNYVISTLTEEFVFRSCMLPLIIEHMSWLNSILITPLFFGTAHLHHIYEGCKSKEYDFKTLLIRHMFQFGYTYSFGVYSSYLFLRTGNFFASFLAHAFCNLMGFPDFDELINENNGKTRVFLVLMYFFGLISFFYYIASFTDPNNFDNIVYLNFF